MFGERTKLGEFEVCWRSCDFQGWLVLVVLCREGVCRGKADLWQPPARQDGVERAEEPAVFVQPMEVTSTREVWTTEVTRNTRETPAKPRHRGWTSECGRTLEPWDPRSRIAGTRRAEAPARLFRARSRHGAFPRRPLGLCSLWVMCWTSWDFY